MIEITEQDKKRFFDKVFKDPNTGCWLWTSYICRGGYGRFSINCKAEKAHRVSWEIAFGPIPLGMYVCHKCDTRKCVNPKCLFLGSPQDNMTDMVIKNRQAKGEKNGSAILSEEQIILIRQDSRTLKEIAKDYNISNSQVCQIKNRKLWKHL